VLISIDAVDVMAAYQPAVWAYSSHWEPYAYYTDEQKKPYFVVLAKHRTAL